MVWVKILRSILHLLNLAYINHAVGGFIITVKTKVTGEGFIIKISKSKFGEIVSFFYKFVSKVYKGFMLQIVNKTTLVVSVQGFFEFAAGCFNDCRSIDDLIKIVNACGATLTITTKNGVTIPITLEDVEPKTKE